MSDEHRYRALSVRQPWAHFVATGEKPIEVRSWFTHYRGPIVIVSSASPDREALERLAGNVNVATLARGVTLAIVDLVDVRHGRASDARAAMCSARDAFAWVFERPRPLRHQPVTGRTSLFWLDGQSVQLARRGRS